MIMFLSKDMFFYPSVRQAAESVGLQSGMAKTAEEAIQFAREHSEELAGVILDLSAISLGELEELFHGLRKSSSSALLSAFGPHVHQLRLDRAREVGFDPVLTKGQLSQSLSVVVGRCLPSN